MMLTSPVPVSRKPDAIEDFPVALVRRQ